MRKADWQFEGSMDAARRAAILEALASCEGSVVLAAARLRIGRSTLYRLLEKFEIEPADVGERQRTALAPHDDKRRGRVVEIDGKWFIVS